MERIPGTVAGIFRRVVVTLLAMALLAGAGRIFPPVGNALAATAYEPNIHNASGGNIIKPGEGVFKNFISVTVTDIGEDGFLNFGNLNPGAVKQPEADSPSILVINDGTANVTVSLKGIDFTGAGTISIGNAFYNIVDDPDTALAMSTSYGPSLGTLAPGENLTIFHWLSIPAGTPPGAYSANFTYMTDEIP